MSDGPMPGMTVISCNAPYGHGGLGQHLAKRVGEIRQSGRECIYYSSGVKSSGPGGREIDSKWVSRLQTHTPVRFDRGLQAHLGMDLFDLRVSRAIPAADTFVGFVGQSLRTFRRARKLGYTRLELEVCNSHVRNVAEKHHAAYLRWGMEKSWLNNAQLSKTLREYEEADCLVYTSDYIRQSLVARGIEPGKLIHKPITVNPRFVPPASRPNDGIFRVVYVGSVTVAKGIPVLMEAFAKMGGDVRLTIVGGWATRAMRIYMSKWLARDSRIRIAPGDPLQAIQEANVLVHPSYEDGFAYSAAEALACETPVIVTEDTGMKELVVDGENGYVVPTGDVDAIFERMRFIQQAGGLWSVSKPSTVGRR